MLHRRTTVTIIPMTRHLLTGLALCALAAGCETKAGTGSLAGAGVGALVGQAIGHNTAGTLIGAGVGTGVGYLIGNDLDKQDAQKRQQATAAEMAPFAGTAWQLLSVNPQPPRPVQSLVARFNPDGTIVTSRTFTDGRLETATESYRVVGDTLIVNRPGYLVNAKFRIDGDRLYLDTPDHGAVLRRV